MVERFNPIPKKLRPVVYSAVTLAALAAAACSGSKDTQGSVGANGNIDNNVQGSNPTRVIEPTATSTPEPLPTPEPTPTAIPKTPEDRIRALSRFTLKDAYYSQLLNTLNLIEKRDGSRNSVTYTQELKLASGETVFFQSGKNASDGQIRGDSILISKDGYPNDDLDTVLAVFNQYFNIPNVSKDAWSIEPDGRGLIYYEIVIPNSDGSFDTRSAYTVRYRDVSRGITIAVGACKMLPASPTFAQKTCIAKS